MCCKRGCVMVTFDLSEVVSDKNNNKKEMVVYIDLIGGIHTQSICVFTQESMS